MKPLLYFLITFCVSTTAFAYAWSEDVTTDSSGNIYAVGTIEGAMVVRKSIDQGDTWTVTDKALYDDAVTRGYAVGTGRGMVVAAGIKKAAEKHFWYVRLSLDGGVTWKAVDDYNYDGYWNYPSGAGIANNGDIYVAGTVKTKDVYHWLVRKSSDKGATWTIVDDYWDTSGGGSESSDLVISSDGTLYATGCVNKGSLGAWVTRKSSDGGATWSNIDDYLHEGSNVTCSLNLKISPSGNLIAAGFADDGSVIRWLTRMSVDGGATWQTVDEYIYGDDTGASAIAVAPNGTIFVGGYYYNAHSDFYGWLTRASYDNGKTWKIADNYVDGYNSSALAMTVTREGNIFASGYIYNGKESLWITRKSADNGASWFNNDLIW